MNGLREYVIGVILILAVVALSVSMMVKPLDPPLIVDDGVDAGSGIFPTAYGDWCDVPRVVARPRVKGVRDRMNIYEPDQRSIS